MRKLKVGLTGKISEDEIIAKCNVCGKPVLGVPFISRYRNNKLKFKDRVAINNMMRIGKAGLKIAKSVGIDVDPEVEKIDREIFGGLIAMHFSTFPSKGHKEILKKVHETGSEQPMLDAMEWNQELRNKWRVYI